MNMKKLLLGFVCLASVAASAPMAQADCTVTFADYNALNQVHVGWARATFAAWSQWDSARNQPMLCRNLSENAWQTSGCWSYRQRCGLMQNGQVAYFNAWPNVNEMHLPIPNNPVLNHIGCFCDPRDGMGGGTGYYSGGHCFTGSTECPEWRNYQRVLTPHDATTNFMMFVEQGSDSVQHVFDMDQFEVFSGIGILCYTDINNATRCFNGLAGYNNYQVNIRDARKAWFYSYDSSVPAMSRATIRTKY
jgi:hypothetical protein